MKTFEANQLHTSTDVGNELENENEQAEDEVEDAEQLYALLTQSKESTQSSPSKQRKPQGNSSKPRPKKCQQTPL